MGLHDQRDDRPLRPAAPVHQHRQPLEVLAHLGEPAEEPERPAVDQDVLQRRHHVGAMAVAHGLDVRALVRVERGRDREPARVVGRADPVRHRAEQRLGVGPREVPEPVRQAGQRAGVLHGVQQALCAERAGGEHDLPGGERPAAAELPARAVGADLVTAVHRLAPWPHDVGGGQRVHHGARPLRQVEVVLDQRVLGAVPAARHALAALDAARPLRPGPAEERVGGPAARRRRLRAAGAEVDAHPGGPEGVTHPHVVRDGPDDVVRGRVPVVLDDTEHALRLVVVRRELALPVGDA